MKIAISGKGGVGKTTIGSMLILELARRGKPVLAIDADPNGGLAAALGYDREISGRLVPLIERRSLIEERTGAKPGVSGGYYVLNPKVNDLVDTFSVPVRGVRTLVMGELKEAMSGCYCSENALLRSFLRHLMVERDEWVVLDMEAGFEHLTRGTAQSVDLLLVVVEPGVRSLDTAVKLMTLARQAGIPKTACIANKLLNDEQLGRMESRLGEGSITLSLPFSSEAVESDLAGVPPWDACPAMAARITDLVDRLVSLTAPSAPTGPRS